MAKFIFNLESAVLKTVKKPLEKIMDDLYFEIRKKSPVRTGKYIASHRNLWIREQNGMLIWTIQSDWEYVERVEYGFRRWPVNWHLYNSEIYRSRWAETYQRALAKIKKNLWI